MDEEGNDFAVVEFLESNEVEIVPISWLIMDEGLCLWPPSGDIKAFVKKRTKPVLLTWKMYEIKVLCRNVSYERACKKLKLATISSDLGTNDEEELDKRQRRKPDRYVYESDELISSEEEDPFITKKRKKGEPNKNSKRSKKHEKNSTGESFLLRSPPKFPEIETNSAQRENVSSPIIQDSPQADRIRSENIESLQTDGNRPGKITSKSPQTDAFRSGKSTICNSPQSNQSRPGKSTTSKIKSPETDRSRPGKSTVSNSPQSDQSRSGKSTNTKSPQTDGSRSGKSTKSKSPQTAGSQPVKSTNNKTPPTNRVRPEVNENLSDKVPETSSFRTGKSTTKKNSETTSDEIPSCSHSLPLQNITNRPTLSTNEPSVSNLICLTDLQNALRNCDKSLGSDYEPDYNLPSGSQEPQNLPSDGERESSPTKLAEKSLKSNGFKLTVLRYLIEIKMVVQEIMSRPTVESMPTVQSIPGRENSSLVLLPVDNLQRFQVLCNDVKDENKKKQLKTLLRNIGAKSAKSLTTKILRFLMTDNVASNFNWEGRNGKFGFEKTPIKDLITEIVRSTMNLKDKHTNVIHTQIKNWLKQAKFRLLSKLQSSKKRQINRDTSTSESESDSTDDDK